MSYFDLYKQRVLGSNDTIRDREREQVRNEFNDYLRQSPTSHEVYYTKVDELPNLETNEKTLMIINDMSNNDKKAYDEKKIMCPMDTNIGTGSYVYWDDTWWLIIFRDNKTLLNCKKYTMNRCNQYFNYKYKGVLYNVPVTISALTLDYMAS